MAQQVKAHIVVFEHSNFRGRHRHIYNEESDLNHKEDRGLNDNISSFVVTSGIWKLYRHSGFSGAYDREFGKGMYSRTKDYDVENDSISSLKSIG